MKNYVLPLSFIGLFFFSIGFAMGINNFLMPVLKGSMEMTPVAANLLIAFTFLPFLIFGMPAGYMLRAWGYKRTMVASFGLFAVAFALFLPAIREQSLTYFLIASFVSGAANTILQAAVNPYITLLGPLESAAQRTCIMGICNKLAWPTTTLFIMLVIGKTDVTQIGLDELTLPFGCIIGIFMLLGIVAMLAPLPEVKGDGEEATADAADGPATAAAGRRPTLWDYPHLLLGALTLFLYVGVETISLSTVTDYAASLGITDVTALGYIASVGMTVGYLLGITCIPRVVSQVTAMRICSVIAIIGSVLTATLPPPMSIYCIGLMALGCSVMWPALWPMAMADLGPMTKQGAGLLTMAIAGGSVLPPLRAWMEQLTGSYQTSYLVCLPCFVMIAWYGFWGYRIRRQPAAHVDTRQPNTDSDGARE